ncbi:low molecular weight phosphotyrosine protein phosphatase [Paracoccus versutus]|uniref:protein-tyrosine-phosphatase n=1 Tax=Paracoccus versutus TaxID=34007 RepID=A0AAQ0HNF7_PARVE|nr:low molecular weight protein-tyrosine-phosphatase [Paracoccus versutus]KGJ02360.1 phosphotyrosine protein phosphatase [Paracoccus versutus]REG57092.1 protein-tyrosine phosphatase [Paracoccus versutus]WEJ77941.1 low molecular weight phosphotyrosine protein phosphatase [Paracoccus versutus]
MPQSVLFVCLGNICRSPLAEAALRAAAEAAGARLLIDSAGTGDWHLGRAPDRRAQAVAARAGIDISNLRARQVGPDDFHRFDHIVAMDHENLAALRRLAPPEGRARLSLLLDHVPGRRGQAVADPYFGEAAGFDATWRDVTAGAQALLRLILGPG